MDLLNRYLATIGFLLSRGQREDITAELRDVLLTQSDEKQAELGHPLTENEEADLLRAFGNPLTVAARYGRHDYLVGPEIYPLYALVVKIALAFVAISAAITGVVTVFVHPTQPGAAIGAVIGVLVSGAISNVGAITIIAAVVQRQNIPARFITDWNPRDLPKLPRKPLFRPERWFDHVGGILVQPVFVLWWTHAFNFAIPYISYVPLAAGQRLDFARGPIWTTLFWPVLGLSAATVAVHALKLWGRAPRATVSVLDIAFRLAILAVMAIALAARHWVEISATGVSAAALAQIDYGVNLGVMIALIAVAVSAAAYIASDVWNLYRGRMSA